MSDAVRIGRLHFETADQRPDLLAEPVSAALRAASASEFFLTDVAAAEIDPELADTAAFCAAYDVPPELSANCVVVAGKREGVQRIAACLVLATTRADVNGVVKRRLDVRKASFLSMDEAVARTGMEYGGITPLGLPEDWPVLVDDAVAELPWVIIGSGLRRSKIAIRGSALAWLATRGPGDVVTGLAR
ncbi:MAG: YbaK/EbsC family protein [Actinomycetota bacterium]|nr:YbaK/EbsC family protein [Actinomycetota bacterium]